MNNTHETNSEKQTPFQVAGRLFGIRNLVIFAPLLIAAVFSFSYMQMQSVQMQRSLANERTGQNTNPVDSLPALPLITQPAVPQLDTKAPDTPTQTATDRTDSQPDLNPGQLKKSIGPSSSDAAKALQGVGDALGGSKNDDIQATRQQIRLDQLDIIGS